MRKIINTYDWNNESRELFKEALDVNKLTQFIVIETIEEQE